MKLSAEAQRLYDSIKEVYGINDPGGELLLSTICESLDMARQAEAEIKKHGIVIEDKYSRLKANPACTVLKDAKTTMLNALKSLNLSVDIEIKDETQPILKVI